MHVPASQLIDALRAKGHRITAARRAVCEVIAEAHSDHLDAATILDRVNTDSTSVNQSTVYRTLEALEEAGVLTHTHLGPGAAVYHLGDEPSHQHLLCSDCGKTVSVAAADLEGWIAQIAARTGFAVDPDHFALSGLCEECARRRREQ